MSKHEKLLFRLRQKPPPVDFRWDELVTLLEGFGCTLHENGGSHNYFVHHSGKKLNTSRPHPSGIMKCYQVRAVVEYLCELGAIDDE